jgi:hypothetical protein
VTWAAACAALLWLARRFVAGIPWKVGILLACLPLAFTGKAFLRGDLYGPSDLYSVHDPWRNAAAENGVHGVANPILSDLAFANIPWRAAVREAFVNGRLPLWNRFVLAGNPLLATAQASVFHPATLLGIFLPLAQSWTFSCAFTIFLALLCAHLFFREFCSSDLPALVGAIGWGFSTYVLFWDGWAVGPSVATFPLLLLGLRRLARAPAEGGGVGITTAALALSFHGGHPETFFHCIAAGAVYFLWEILPRDRRHRSRRAVVGALAAGALAFGLAAPVLLPLLEALPQSAEYAARRAALAEGRVRQSVPAEEAARRLRPAILPFAHGIYGRSPVQAERQDGSGMPLAYAGAVLFPLAAIGTFGRRPLGRAIFLGFLLAGLAYGASAPILLDATARLPGFSLALNYRLVFLAPLGIAGLAALGADRLIERRASSRQLAIAVAAVLAALGLSFALARGVFRERNLPAGFVGVSFAHEALPVFLLGLAAIPGRNGERRAIAAAVGLLAAQRVGEMGGVYPTLPARSVAPLPAVASLPKGGDPYRVVAPGETLRPNGAALSRLEDVRGYESLVLRRFEETYSSWCRRQFASFNRVDDLGSPFLSFLNVRYAIGRSDEAVPRGWTLAARTRQGSTFENPRALSRAFLPETVRNQPDSRKRRAEMSTADDFSRTAWVDGADARDSPNGAGSVRVREIGADLVIEADVRERAFVATSVPDWPGWSARSDGGAIALATVNHAFVGFWLPPGRHEVRLHYRPPSFRAGVALAATALVAGLLVAVLRRRRGLT